MSSPLRRWLRRPLPVPHTAHQPAAPRARPLRLALEMLEGRTVPAVYTVTTSADVVDPNDGLLSLREAVIAANSTKGIPDTIVVPAGSYALTRTGADEDATATGDLDVTDDLTVQGDGAASTIIDGNAADRVFDLKGTVTRSVTLAGLTIRNGRAVPAASGATAGEAHGGGILSQVSLTLTDCVVTGNEARGADATGTASVTGRPAFGGGIESAALTLVNTRVVGNTAAGGKATTSGSLATATGGAATGGGVYYTSGIGSVTVTNSTIADNQAVGGTATQTGPSGWAYGGAASAGGLYGGDLLTLTSSTLSGNRAVGGDATATAATGSTARGGDASGGGLVGAGSGRSVSGSTVSDNTARGGAAAAANATGGDARGGGVSFSAYGSETLANLTVSGNVAQGGGATTSGGTARGGGGFGGGFSLSVVGSGNLLANTTITLNTAAGGAGGVAGTGAGGGVTAASGGTTAVNKVEFSGTLVAGNTAATAPDVRQESAQARLVSRGGNLIGDGSGILSGLADGVNGDQAGTPAAPIDPRLGPLADNGGPTKTHALLPGSPALDRGADTLRLTYDQRGPGFVRRFGPPDVGAFELAAPGVPTALAAAADVTAAGGTAYTFTVTYSDDTAVAVGSLGDGDVRVTGPNGFTAPASLVGVDTNTDGTPRTATYRVTPPGGSWDGADAGTYTVSLESGQVTDAAGNAVPAGPLTAFRVVLPGTLVVSNADDSGPGSLRAALEQANAFAPTADTVVFDPTFFATPRTITLTEDLPVSDSVSILGPGADKLTLNGAGAYRVFTIDSPARLNVTLAGLRLTGGHPVYSPSFPGGGAIFVRDDTVTVRDCVIEGNTSDFTGGAITVSSGGSLTLQGSTVRGNTSLSEGGGLWLSGAAALTVSNSTIVSNTANGGNGGGGIRITGGTAAVTNSQVINNTTTGSGGGIYASGTDVTIRASTVANNQAGGGGGGKFQGSPLQVFDSTFSGNRTGTYGRGGAIEVTPAATAPYEPRPVLLQNSTLTGNSANGAGGGLAMGVLTSGSNVLTIQNCTITANSTAENSNGAGGGGLYVPPPLAQDVTVTSSIVSGNRGAAGPSDINAGAVLLTDSAVGSATGFTVKTGSGNNVPFGADIRLAPQADNGGPTQTHALLAGSPALDRGSNPAGLANDQRGTGFPRGRGAAVDIGAFEGVWDTPWADAALTDLTGTAGAPDYTFTVTYTDDAAIDVSTLGTGDVRVTGPNGLDVLATFVGVDTATNGTPRTATYRFAAPGGTWEGADNGTYTVTLQPNQVADATGRAVSSRVLGTFRVFLPLTLVVTNTNDSGPGSLRDAVAKANAPGTAADVIVFDPTYFATPRTITLTSGRLVVTDSLTVTGPGADRLTVSGNNASRVFDAALKTGHIALTISGLRMTGGRAVGNSPAIQNYGGAVLAWHADLTLRDCVLEGNSAPASGGAVSVSAANLAIESCKIIGNTAGEGGGGVSAGSFGYTTVIRNSTIADNTAVAGSGGGLSVGWALIQGCTISGNIVQAYAKTGGGIDSQGPLTVLDSMVSGNQALQGIGGGINWTSAPSGVIRNCTIAANSAYMGGGGLWLAYNFPPYNSVDIQNCTITGNTVTLATNGGGGINAATPQGHLSVTSSIVSGNTIGGGTIPDDIRNVASNPIDLSDSAVGSPNGLTVSSASGNNLPFGIDLRLGPLQDNGGPTLTVAPRPGSPLLDAGSNPAGLTTDQRGFPRAVGTATDIGAVEGVSPTPTAVSTLRDVTAPGGTVYLIRVEYSDDTAVAVRTLGDGDVRVTGPNGFAAAPTFVGADVNSDGTVRTATYALTPPGGSWDPYDYGTFTVTVEAGQVADTGGTFVPPAQLGTFRVVMPATFVVTNAKDAGPGSLRDALLQANANSGAADTVVFDPAFFATPRTITLTTGTLPISDPVTVIGPGATTLALNGNAASRIFTVDGPGRFDVVLSGLALTNGFSAGGNGGAIFSRDEYLTVRDCVFTGNVAAGNGGAICVGWNSYRDTGASLTLERCTLTGNRVTGSSGGSGGAVNVEAEKSITVIRDCTIADNSVATSSGVGGGVSVDGGVFLLEDSTVSGDRAYEGGGLYFFNPFATGGLVIRNSTVSGNTAASVGGGIALHFVTGPTVSDPGRLTLQDTTVTRNTAAQNGGGIANFYLGSYSGTVEILLDSSIVSGNTNADSPDVSSNGPVIATSSAIGSPAGFTLTASSSGNLPFGSDLKLGPLADNGGPTKTHALLAGSPAIDAGANPADLLTDQRGPGFPRTVGPQTDIGAFEYVPSVGPNAVAPTLPDVGDGGGTAYTIAVTYADDQAVSVASLAASTLTVAGPGGFAAPARFVGVDDPSDGPVRTATYLLTPPGGAWDYGDNGAYAVTIAAGQVKDTAGNAVPAGLLGRFAVAAPPVVRTVRVNDGSAQRSRVTSLTVTFDSTVSFAGDPAEAFVLTRSGGRLVGVNVATQLVGGATVATLTFFGTETESGSLRDGDYTLTVLGSQVLANAEPLDGNGDGVPGGDYRTGVYRYFGDANGDRTVDALDLFTFAGGFGKRRGDAGYLDYLDRNGDGALDALDLFAFAGNFGKTLS